MAHRPRQHMTIGLIGLGSIGERHAHNIQAVYPNASLDILTKRTRWEDAGKRARLVQSEKLFFDTKHDVYFITNETNKHANTILKCLAKKPAGIFVEKPLSHSLANIPKLRSIAKKQRTVFVVGYNLHYFQAILEMQKLLTKETIGTILSMRVFVGKDLRAWRKGDYRDSYSAKRSEGGGVVLDLIHDLNYPAFLLGEQLQFVAGGSSRVSNLKIDTEDIAESIFRTKKGAIVSVHQDYLATPGKRSCEIVGEKGTVSWEWQLGEQKSTIRVSTAAGSRTRTIWHKDLNRMYIDEMKAFMRHVQSRDRYTNLPEAIANLENALTVRSRSL